MAEIDVKFMKANRALARDIGVKIKPDKKAASSKSTSKSKAKKK